MKSVLTILTLSLFTLTVSAQEPVKEWFEDGSLKAEYVAQEAGNVSAIFYYHTGQVRETGQFVNEQRDGTWLSYSRSGNVTAEGHYTEGARSGNWKFWNLEGQLTHEVDYSGDKPQLVVHNISE